MSTVFIGGSRQISSLPPQVKERLDNVIRSRFSVVVGDASGADKAVQKYLLNAGYKDVTVFCSGETCRNNLGKWLVHYVPTPKSAKGFQHYAAKDREMARRADFGLMVWDGKSVGTALNILRLVRSGQKAVLLDIPAKEAITFKSDADWTQFISSRSAAFRIELKKRATPEEWAPSVRRPQASLFDPTEKVTSPITDDVSDDQIEYFERTINAAFADGDFPAVVNALGTIAKAKGMSHVAKQTGLARESLYRALTADGNPEFATVVRVLASLGFRLSVSKAP